MVSALTNHIDTKDSIDCDNTKGLPWFCFRKNFFTGQNAKNIKYIVSTPTAQSILRELSLFRAVMADCPCTSPSIVPLLLCDPGLPVGRVEAGHTRQHPCLTGWFSLRPIHQSWCEKGEGGWRLLQCGHGERKVDCRQRCRIGMLQCLCQLGLHRRTNQQPSTVTTVHLDTSEVWVPSGGPSVHCTSVCLSLDACEWGMPWGMMYK